ncbi:F0F1 ATP synthase subunit B [Buchnera aphidicola (Aphis craccivora)]|uniref:ATP synthase subunit b n=1 Tax=Buchnera aphidicola (Aphis craccivora) TaxID=466616 RepID=A0A4D6XKS1_9GAMM|nr:F0F1 ATP synthase subunit B [Buchnera aphidicola]QCI16279.1 F0F1 ATP synthase subunit B [Buchnera aphidicola (Aphis craccivora)]QLL40424.1 F0F1 ATP synthase subunit B [Buchnera aphidicola (Aphis craccivore)]WAI17795.1 MAG: F0F1 ATP synthase subunit B [Buchnera aphidicola (Aphis craccivora)]
MNLNATIIGQAISFFLFVWFCMKYIWPPIILAIETRQKKIEDTLISSKKMEQEYLIMQKKMHKMIKDTKEKASCILNEANQKRLLILEEARNKAIEESKKILLKRQAEIDMQFINARQKLQKEIIDLSILMTEKMIQKNTQENKNKFFLNNIIHSLSEIKNQCR